MKYIFVFAAMLALDFIYAEYTKACADRRRLWASAMAGVMPLFLGYLAISYVGDPTTIAAACLGAFCGTWLSLKYGRD